MNFKSKLFPGASKFVLGAAFSGVSGIALAEETNFPPVSCFDVPEGYIISDNPIWFNDTIEATGGFDDFSLSLLRDFQEELSIHQKKLFLVFPTLPILEMPTVLSLQNDISPDLLREEYNHRISQLQGANLNVLNSALVLDKYRESFDLQRQADHHWTSEAGIATAYEVVNILNGNLPSSSPDDFLRQLEVLIPNKSDYIFSPSAWRSSSNDTCDLSQYNVVESKYSLPNEVVDSGENINDLLFGSSGSTIALFGTSFSTDVDNQFERAIGYFSHRPVVGYQLNGGGAPSALFSGLMEVASQEDVTDIIWESPHLHFNSLTAGAASLGAGMLAGSCNPQDPLYREFEINSKYGQWAELHDFVGSFDILEVRAPFDVTVALSMNFISNAGEILRGLAEVELTGINIDNLPYTGWTFRVPELENGQSTIGSLSSVSVRLTTKKSEGESTDISYVVAGCMKFESERYAGNI